MGILATTGSCNCSTSLGLIKLLYDPESRKTRVKIFLSLRLRMTLKTTNERQDYGAGILHQEAQFPIDQVYLIYKAPMPLSAHARPRETRYWLQMQVGLYVPLNPPPLAHRGS